MKRLLLGLASIGILSSCSPKLVRPDLNKGNYVKLEILRSTKTNPKDAVKMISHADSILESYGSDLRIIKEDTLTQPEFARTPEVWAFIARNRIFPTDGNTILSYIDSRDISTQRVIEENGERKRFTRGIALPSFNILAFNSKKGRGRITYTHELFHILFGTVDLTFNNPLSRIRSIYSYANKAPVLDMANTMIVETNIDRPHPMRKVFLEYLQREQSRIGRSGLDKNLASLVVGYTGPYDDLKPYFLKDKKEFLIDFLEAHPDDILSERIRTLLERKDYRSSTIRKSKKRPAIIGDIMEDILIAEEAFQEKDYDLARERLEDAIDRTSKIPNNYEFKDKIEGYVQLSYLLVRARQDGKKGSKVRKWLETWHLIDNYKKAYESFK